MNYVRIVITDLKRDIIKTAFQKFYQYYSHLELEQVVEYFSIFGGMEKEITLAYDDDIFSMVTSSFVNNFKHYENLIRPSYLLETPYRKFLIAIARGDGKIYSAFNKARLSESVGHDIVNELITLNILNIEYSREVPLRTHPKHKLKKEQRAYRIQDKLRFTEPFMRCWFGFVSFYSEDLREGRGELFLENFRQHYERLRSLVYEQLCNDILNEYYQKHDPIIYDGSYWDIYSEFDILSITKNKKTILGECKYKDRMVCKNELTKLQMKALESGIKVDMYALFSKSGFSKELLGMKDEKLLLFDLDDLNSLLSKK